MTQVSNVVQFPRHKRQRCEHRCSKCCNDGGDCMLDVLFLCATCGGAEGSLPTHCPGYRMDQVMQSTVQRGTADYVNGEWLYYGLTTKECFDG